MCSRKPLCSIVVRLVTELCLFQFLGVTAQGELIAIERHAADVASDVRSGIEKQLVVVAGRQVGKVNHSWAVHEAIATEVAAALCAAGIDAVPASFDSRIESLGNAKVEFTATDAKRAKAVGRDVLVGACLTAGEKPTLKVVVWPADKDSPTWTKQIDLSPEAISLETNVPPLNRKLVEFCRANFDRKVGDGVCAQLATVGLEQAGAKRSGIYTWGRELDEQEPVIPGDVLQLELVEMKSPGFSRGFHHHTAVVEEARPDALVVFHQNVKPKGEIVQRDTWPRAAFKSGTMVAFRPWTGSSPLPPLSPRRRVEPTFVRRGPAIDLLHTLHPRLDSVKGIWFMEDRTLRPNRDDYARLQVPVTPPANYTLRLKVERLFGKDQFAVGLIVGGQQTMASLDAYGGTVSGLHLVDGKTVKKNPTTFTGQVLPENKVVPVKVQVTPKSVTLEAGGKRIVDWNGSADQLSQDPKYAVPRTDWMYLATWNTQFSVSEFWLDEAK